MEIIRGKINKATKTVIYGPEGIGKSTLAARFPETVFIDTEGSTSRMDVARFPAPSSWTMLLQEVEEVKRNPSLCKTLVIDTADWAEKLCVEHICTSRSVKGIEDFGYGKGYTYVKEEFGKLLNALTELIDNGVNVVITAHAIMRKFEQPDEMGAYDRWELKLSKQTAPLVKEWADMILFCNYKTMVVNVDNKGAQKGKNKAQGGKRVMYATHHACWDAKNRDGLPDEMDMGYEEIRHVIEMNALNSKPISEPEQPKATFVDTQREAQKARDEPTPEEMPAKSETVETSESEPVSKYFSDTSRIPKSLLDLMNASDISEWDIQAAVFSKGYYPEGTLIQDMDPGFIEGVLVGAWSQVYKLAKEIKDTQAIPFN